MATRALVGFIQDGPKLISTYNHYDGYPENLGKGLDSHYSMPEEALKIASMGYISYMNPETGEIEAKHKEPADKTPLPDDFQEAMFKVAEMGDSYGADYIYIYNVETSEWDFASLGRGIRGAAQELMGKLGELEGGIFAPVGDDLGVPGDNALGLEEGDYNAKWKSFLNEETFDQAFDRIDKEEDVYPGKYPVEKIMSQAMFRLQDEPKEMLDAYKASLANDIRLNGKEQYEDYSVEDFVEDYENYIADKMDS
jgi:hypothetical protein